MKINDGDNVRDMTDEEIATNELIKKGVADSLKAEATATADKEKAKAALLDRLGITADEAALLLG
jgi:hypothetical protein